MARKVDPGVLEACRRAPRSIPFERLARGGHTWQMTRSEIRRKYERDMEHFRAALYNYAGRNGYRVTTSIDRETATITFRFERKTK